MSYEEVILSDGEKMAVGKLRWSAYKQLRAIIARAIASDVARAVSALFALWEEFSKANASDEINGPEDLLRLFDMDKLQTVLLGVESVNDVLAEAWPVLIHGCLKPSNDFDIARLESLPAEDFLLLGQAAIKKADISNLIAIEGNSLAAAVTVANKTPETQPTLSGSKT